MLPPTRPSRRPPSPVGPDVALDRVAAWRLGRLREQLHRADAALAVLTSPVSLRYATDFRDYALFQSHIPVFYAFVAADGRVINARREPHRGRPLRRSAPRACGELLQRGREPERRGARPRPGRHGFSGRHRRLRASRRRGVRQPEHHGRADAGRAGRDRRRRSRGPGAVRQVRRRDRVHALVPAGGGGRHEADGGGARAGNHREPAMGAAARDEHLQRRGLDRRADALLRPQNQPLVSGGDRQDHRCRRARRLRHRHDRVRSATAPDVLQDLALRGRRGNARAARDLSARLR